MKLSEFKKKTLVVGQYESPPKADNEEDYYPSLDDLEEILADDLHSCKDYILWLTLRPDEELNDEQIEVKENLMKILPSLYGLEMPT